MADRAIGRKPGCHVIGIRGSLEIRRVTGIALRRHRLELGTRCSLVAGIAVNGGMRSGQRKTVIVLLNLIDRHLPSADRVTLLAIRSQLPPVNICVAVLTSLPNIREIRFYVALCAGY